MTRNADPSESTRGGLPRKPSLPDEDPRYYEALGRAIKVARTQQDLSRRTLAERAGVSYAYLSDIETGRGRPSSKALLAVAAALGRSPSELLQEAELYGAMRELSDPAPQGDDTPSDVGAREVARWFHAGPAPRPASSIEAVAPVALTRTEWQRLARSRMSGQTASEREELHGLVEGLSDDDVAVILAIARRLFGR